MIDLSSFRGYLSRSDLHNDFSYLVSGLGFEAVSSAIDYMQDQGHPCHRRLKELLDGLRRIGHFDAQGTPVGLWLAESRSWPKRLYDRDRIRRRTAKTLVEVEPHGDTRVLFILAHPGQDDFELVFPRVRAKGEVGTVRALINRINPNNHHLSLLSELEVTPGLNLLGLSRKWADAFDVERVTKAFYLEFKAVRDRFVKELAARNPDTFFADKSREGEARRFATRNVGRVLFLWFLQSKGWLDNDPYYLLNLFEKHCRTDLSHNFFRDSLVPLFFEALAVKPENRNQRAMSLGDLPYLNGGLFLQTHLEDELYGPDRGHVHLEVPNDLFDPSSPEGASLLGLLRSYRFTTQESTPDNLSVDPDPELLGKVFENLNEEAERKSTGTFYTPREIVRFMCRETLDGYLIDKTGVTKETLDKLRREAEDPESENLRLTLEERMTIESALRNVTVCDPAVGSGAFPVGMLQEIIELRRGLYQSADTLVSPGGQTVAEWKREAITHSLYGVDINPEAVEICQLRLWLSLVIDADRPEPLPNLDFRFIAGDSLIDRVGSDTLRYSLPTQDHLGLLDPVREAELAEIEAVVFVKQEEFAGSTDPGEARRLREEIRGLQVQATALQIEWLKEQGESHLFNLRRQYEERERLGANARELGRVEKQIKAAEGRLEVVNELLLGLELWAPYLKPMLWPVEFPDIFAAGGFDIVVANPPYVRQERLSPADQEAYRSAFDEVYLGTADLYVYFWARALQVCSPGGMVSFITSNAFTKRAYGQPLRRHLERNLTLRRVLDFGEVAVFDAAVEPYVIVARNSRSEENSLVSGHQLFVPLARAGGGRTSVASTRDKLQDLDELLISKSVTMPQRLFARGDWRIDTEGALLLFQRLLSEGVPLSEFVKGRMYRGVLTGLNEAFVIDEDTQERLVTEDANSAELIKPWLRGQDVKRWKAAGTTLCILAIQSSGDSGCQHPWRNETNERSARSVFAESYPAVYSHLSQYEEKLRSRADQGRFWWELRPCAYYSEFAEPKIVWASISRTVRFSWDETRYYPNDKCVIWSAAPIWALGIMNSSLGAFIFHMLTNTVPGGFMELKQAYLESFPMLVLPKDLGGQISELVEVLVKDPGRADTLEPEVNRLVYEAYGLSTAQQTLVDDWLVRWRMVDGVEVNEGV